MAFFLHFLELGFLTCRIATKFLIRYIRRESTQKNDEINL